MKKAALVVAGTGALLSFLLMIHAGRYSMPTILIVLIGMWVLLPYDAMILGNVLAPRWSPEVGAMLYRMTFLVTIASLIVYAASAFGPPRAKPAFYFVLVPPVALLVLGASLGIAAASARKRA